MRYSWLISVSVPAIVHRYTEWVGDKSTQQNIVADGIAQFQRCRRVLSISMVNTWFIVVLFIEHRTQLQNDSSYWKTNGPMTLSFLPFCFIVIFVRVARQSASWIIRLVCAQRSCSLNVNKLKLICWLFARSFETNASENPRQASKQVNNNKMLWFIANLAMAGKWVSVVCWLFIRRACTLKCYCQMRPDDESRPWTLRKCQIIRQMEMNIYTTRSRQMTHLNTKLNSVSFSKLDSPDYRSTLIHVRRN